MLVVIFNKGEKMRRIYNKVNTNYLMKMHEKIGKIILDYLPKEKHRALLELLEIERELTLREE